MTHHDRHTDADATQGGATLQDDVAKAIYAEMPHKAPKNVPTTGATDGRTTMVAMLLAVPWESLSGFERQPFLKAARAALALATRREPSDAGRVQDGEAA